MLKPTDYLLKNELAPLTFCWGFIRAPLEATMDTFRNWQRRTLRNTKTKSYEGDLQSILRGLEPLDIEGRTAVFCETKGNWTAYFDNSARGAEAENVVSVVADNLDVIGCVFVAIPNTITGPQKGKPGVWGCHGFKVYGKTSLGCHGLLRSLVLQNDAEGWGFESTGQPIIGEDSTEYNQGRGVERFDLNCLRKLGRALELDAFSEHFYGPKARYVYADYFFRSKPSAIGLDQARRDIGIAK